MKRKLFFMATLAATVLLVGSTLTISAQSRDVGSGRTPNQHRVVPSRGVVEPVYYPALETIPGLQAKAEQAITEALTSIGLAPLQNFSAEAASPPITLQAVLLDGRQVTIYLLGDTSDLSYKSMDAVENAIFTKLETVPGLSGDKSEARAGDSNGSQSPIVFSMKVNGQNFGDIKTLLAIRERVREYPDYSPIAGPDDPFVYKTLYGRRILLNPGHGLYPLSTGGYGTQRIVYRGIQNPGGVQEDYTNMYAARRAYDRLIKAGAFVYSTRELNMSNTDYGESGRPRWMEGAMLYLKSKGLPSAIWNSGKKISNYSDGLSNDIIARSLYENYLLPECSISFHSNAKVLYSNYTDSGTLGMYNRENERNNKPFAQPLYNQVISGLRSSVSQNWRDNGLSDESKTNCQPGDFDCYLKYTPEVTAMVRPTLTLELAYHSNPNDLDKLLTFNLQDQVAQSLVSGLEDYFLGKDNIQGIHTVEKFARESGEINGLLQGSATFGVAQPQINVKTYLSVYYTLKNKPGQTFYLFYSGRGCPEESFLYYTNSQGETVFVRNLPCHQ